MVLLLKAGKRQSSSSARYRRFSLLRLMFFGVLAFFLLVLIINVHVSSFGKKYVLRIPAPIDSEDLSGEVPVAIVLGASVYSDGTLSPLLEERAVMAFGLYTQKLAKKILVSGDNHVMNYNEVIPIRQFLLDKGVPPEDIFTDFAGFDTYDTMYRAVKIFGVKDAFVVTQNFHLPRALYAARNVGLNAYGVAADTENVNKDKKNYRIQNNVRELFATAKTYFEVVTDAPSLFLGRQIPIAGDGRDSLK